MSTEVSDRYSINSVSTSLYQTVLWRAAGVDMMSVLRQVEVRVTPRVIPRVSVEVSDESDDGVMTPVQVCD